MLKNKKRTSEKHLKSRKQFVDECKQIFWAISQNFELKAAASLNPILTENFQWLQALKDPTRHVTMGSKDVKTSKKLERKLTERNKELERKMMKYPNKESESVDVEGNLTDNEKFLNYDLLSYYGLELRPLPHLQIVF